MAQALTNQKANPSRSRWAGYVRVSTSKQDTDMQTLAIKKRFESDSKPGDVLDFYNDVQTGGTMDRPEMKRLISDIDKGRIDVVCVYALDRISRSMIDGLVEIDKWQRAGVRLVSIKDSLDVKLDDWFGNAVVKIMTTFILHVAESERMRIRQRVMDGIARKKEQQKEAMRLYANGVTCHQLARKYNTTIAKARKMAQGKLFPGRKRGSVAFDRNKFISMVESDYSSDDVCKILGIHRSTYYREVQRMREEQGTARPVTLEECAEALGSGQKKTTDCT